MPVEGLFSTTVEVLSKSVSLRTRQQNLIASNIANAETPGYIPKSLDFEQQLQSAVKSSNRKGSSSNSERTSHPMHIPLKSGAGASLQRVAGKIVDTPAKTPGRDGNAVEMENEMNRMMQNQVLFNASTQLLTQKFSGIRAALKENK